MDFNDESIVSKVFQGCFQKGYQNPKASLKDPPRTFSSGEMCPHEMSAIVQSI